MGHFAFAAAHSFALDSLHFLQLPLLDTSLHSKSNSMEPIVRECLKDPLKLPCLS